MSDTEEYYTSSENEEYDEDDTTPNVEASKIKLLTKDIRSVYDQYLKNNITNLQPTYQRSITWSFEKMLLFLDSLYYCPITPAYILYRLSKKELLKLRSKTPNSNTLYECIDGQHRLYVIYKFITGEPIKIGKILKYLYIKDKDKKTKLFYTITDNIKLKLQYKSNIRELNIDEKETFNSTELSVQVINQYLDDFKKRNIFNRLQNGERVSLLDKLKNTENPITNYMRENDLFNHDVLYNDWKDILILKDKIDTKTNISINLNNLVYFIIRLIVITDKQNLNCNYLNMNVNKSIKNNTEMTLVHKTMEFLMSRIVINKSLIATKLNGQKINKEFYYLIHTLLNNELTDKFNNLHTVLNNSKLFKKFNNIHTSTQTVLKIETMEKMYTELKKLL